MQMKPPGHFLGIYHSPEDAPQEALSERAETLLRWRILNGVFVGGERIREQLIARELDVSRATIREATRRLYGAGLVEIDAQRGVFVRTYSLEQIEDIIDVRCVLSDLTARLFLKRATDADRKRVEDVYARLTAAEVRPYQDDDYMVSLLFNEAVVRATNSERVYTLDREAWQQMRIFKLFLKRHISGPVDIQAFNQTMYLQGAKHRRALYDAIGSGSRARIAGALRRAAEASLGRARGLFADYLRAMQPGWRKRILSGHSDYGPPEAEIKIKTTGEEIL